MRPCRNMFALSCSVAQLCPTLCDPMDCSLSMDPLSMGFSRQEYRSGLPFPPPRDLPDPGIEPVSLVSPALAGRFFTTALPGKPQVYIKQLTNRIQCENREESQRKLGIKSSSGRGLGEEIQGQGFLGTYGPLHFFWPPSISFIQFFFLVLNPQNGLTVFLTVLVRPVFNGASQCVNLCHLICSSFFILFFNFFFYIRV